VERRTAPSLLQEELERVPRDPFGGLHDRIEGRPIELERRPCEGPGQEEAHLLGGQRGELEHRAPGSKGLRQRRDVVAGEEEKGGAAVAFDRRPQRVLASGESASTSSKNRIRNGAPRIGGWRELRMTAAIRFGLRSSNALSSVKLLS